MLFSCGLYKIRGCMQHADHNFPSPGIISKTNLKLQYLSISTEYNYIRLSGSICYSTQNKLTQFPNIYDSNKIGWFQLVLGEQSEYEKIRVYM